MGIRWQITFSKIELNFTQFVNQNVKIQGRRLYSPSLEDVAWLEDTQSIFLIFHTLSVNWLGRWMSRHSSQEENYRQMYGKLDKLIEHLLAKLHPSNLVNTIFCLVF